ncbi:hypothetical protein TNCV_58141 [Trichonephila clavipes]|nr:hypothetical protein TNCV_58141 [Trichonephila clavipes]
MLAVLGKKAVLEWCMKEGLIGSSYVCPKCGKSMELRERTEFGQIPDSHFSVQACRLNERLYLEWRQAENY